MTLDDLLNIGNEASDDVAAKAERMGLCPSGVEMGRARVKAIVEALRDEMTRLRYSHGSLAAFDKLDEILASDGEVKAAGGDSSGEIVASPAAAPTVGQRLIKAAKEAELKAAAAPGAEISLDVCTVHAIKAMTDAEIERRYLEIIPPNEEAPRVFAGAPESSFDLVKHLERQIAFSLATFGPGRRTAGVVDHIRKELLEVEADPEDASEWVDVIILGFDGAWRVGLSPQEIGKAIAAKQAKNEARSWPDWRTVDPDKAIEHDRSADHAAPRIVAAVGVGVRVKPPENTEDPDFAEVEEGGA